MGRATAGLLAAALLCAAAEASVIEVTSVSNVVGGAIDLGAGRTASGDTSSNAFLPFDEKLVRSLSLPQNGGMGVIHSTLQSTMTSSLLSADGVAESSLFMNEAVQNAGASAVALYSVEFDTAGGGGTSGARKYLDLAQQSARRRCNARVDLCATDAGRANTGRPWKRRQC